MGDPGMGRMVLYADLLGFRNRVKEAPLETIVRSLKDTLYGVCAGAVRYSVRCRGLDEISRLAEEITRLPELDWDDPGFSSIVDELRSRTGLSAVLMSDTVVLYSGTVAPQEPGFRETLASILLVGRVLMMKLFEFHLPARGAISFGEFHAEARNSIYCGKALVESYELAESQDWIGMSICDSLETHVDALLASFSIENYCRGVLAGEVWRTVRPDWDVIRYQVPLKQGPQERWTVNWSSAWNFGGPVRDDFFAEQMTGKETVDQKYKNTLAYLQWIHTLRASGKWPQFTFALKN